MANPPAERFDFLQPPARPGDLGRLGPYHVIRPLGRGGMGQVFEAQDSRLMRTVALKVMNRRFAASPNSRRRFLTEARAMAAVHHPHVVTIFEVAEWSGTPCMAMELLRGGNLRDVTQTGRRWAPAEILHIARDVTDGLQAAHRVGIVHRDIKPANLWVDDSVDPFRIKILDFGLALAGGGFDRLSDGTTVFGTAGYLSPEQARNEPLDDRTDLYSLGVVLYELCTGRLPFPAKTVLAQLVAILTREPATIPSLNAEIPQPLAECVHGLLAKEPAHRPRSAEALAAEIRGIERQLQAGKKAPLAIRVESPQRPSGSRPAAAAGRGEGSAPTRPRRMRNKVAVASTTAALVVLAIIGLAWGLSRDSRSDLTAGSGASTRDTATNAAAADRPVLAASLTPLTLTEIVAAPTNVPRGEPARFRLGFANRAADAADDPKRLHADAKVVAQIVATFRQSGGLARKVPAFPKRFSPTQLPAPGQTLEVDFQFLTENLPREELRIEFELQSPAGAKLASLATPLTVTENLRVEELLGFERLRTHAGRGADRTVRPGGGKDEGSDAVAVLGVDRRGDQDRELAILRFDLSRSPVPAAEIDRAVLLLTVADGGFRGISQVAAYGIPADQTPDWDERDAETFPWKRLQGLAESGGLRFLGQTELDNRGGQLEKVADGVRIFGPDLDDFLRDHPADVVTIVVTRHNSANKPTRFRSKEAQPDHAPALAVRPRRP